MSKIKQDAQTQRHARLIATIAHTEHFQPVGETVGKLWGVSAKTPSVSASAFVIWLLHRAEKPMNENRIQKEIKKNKVALGHKSTKDLLTDAQISGFIECVYSPKDKGPARLDGYVLSKDMKKLIEENKPGEED